MPELIETETHLRAAEVMYRLLALSCSNPSDIPDYKAYTIELHCVSVDVVARKIFEGVWSDELEDWKALPMYHVLRVD